MQKRCQEAFQGLHTALLRGCWQTNHSGSIRDNIIAVLQAQDQTEITQFKSKTKFTAIVATAKVVVGCNSSQEYNINIINELDESLIANRRNFMSTIVRPHDRAPMKNAEM